MKSLIKAILRELGMLRWARKIAYKNQYRNYIRVFKGQSDFTVNFRGIETKFSVEDPFSATFFAVHFQNGIYEEDGLKVLFEQVKDDSVVLDVGANIGYFTCIAAKYCKKGRVFGFELGRENFAILNRNIELNSLDNIVTECVAVSDQSGTVKVEDSAVGNAVLKIIEDSSKSDLIPVNSVSLDDYCKAHNVAPDFIKIDVEGAEMKVLHGMKNILTGNVEILVEIHEKDLLYFHSSKEEVLSFLGSLGFTLRFIGNDVKKNILVHAARL